MNNPKFELVGGLAGQTINLGGHVFVDGVFEYGPDDGIFPGPDDVQMKARYLATSYQAYLVGSDELEAAKVRLKNNQSAPGLLDVPTREIEEQAKLDAPKTAPVVAEPVVAEPVVAESAAVPVVPAMVEAPKTSDRARNGAIRTGLTKLDATNDEHWTEAGLPSVNAVRELSGQADIGRAEIAALAPKLNREEAAKIASEDPLA